MDVMGAIRFQLAIHPSIVIHVTDRLRRQIDEELERTLESSVVAIIVIANCLGIKLGAVDLVFYENFQCVTASDGIQKAVAQIDIDAVIFLSRLNIITPELLLILFYREFAYGFLCLK